MKNQRQGETQLVYHRNRWLPQFRPPHPLLNVNVFFFLQGFLLISPYL